MTTDGDFKGIVADIYSAAHVRILAAAGAWIALAGAGTSEEDRLSGTASAAQAETGVGLIELAERVEGTASWAGGAGAVARRIAEQLSVAGESSARATEEALGLEARYDEASETPAGPDVGMAAVSAAERQHEEKQKLIRAAEDVRARLGATIAQVTGGDVPAAPGGGAGGGGAGGGAGGSGGAGSGGGGAAGAGAAGSAGAAGHGGSGTLVQAANGAHVGVGDYPYSRVLGPDQGDFAGWVQSPGTGFLVDPATGREFDTVTGRWIDPVTGQPFGEVTEYATRYSGLGTGPGTIAAGFGTAGAGAIGAGGTAAGLAGLYGGMMPPSVGHTGPARGQMVQQATRNLHMRATVAGRFALHEAAQGGRPFTPPPGAAASRAGGTGRGGAAGRRATAESPGAVRARPRDAAARLAGGPPPAAAAARTRDRAEERTRYHRPTELTEDPSVWASGRKAGPGVLGE
ncbi:hypothetical protein [Streptomyces sp. MP131-18]|uniref:hypothetical protein n=1 Tax=Streptomyces sp. MP131-18 TaxID=1857892 RepID=UPI00097BF095|nr:hypothetical protein [Streptomyces sp. MP131-18]ONK12457.1 hypothetical protein STBA_31990 [Streptomyces sp. MP131-18]